MGYKASKCEEFKAFIEDMKLIDVPSVSGCFTWFNGAGNAMSIFGMFLLSASLVSSWKISGQEIGKRDISDHCLIWMQSNFEDWGPKSFRFNNCQIKHEKFREFIAKEWNNLVVTGIGDFIFKEKLEMLKEKLKWWNKAFLAG